MNAHLLWAVVNLLVCALMASSASAASRGPIRQSSAKPSGPFEAAANLPAPRWHHMATRLSDGRVLLAGGLGADGNTAIVYDPRTGRFLPAGNMSAYRTENTATLLADGAVRT